LTSSYLLHVYFLPSPVKVESRQNNSGVHPQKGK